MAESRATEIALVKQALTNITSKLTSIEQQLETKYAQATELALARLANVETEKRLQSNIDDLEEKAAAHEKRLIYIETRFAVYATLLTIAGAGATIVIQKIFGL